MTRIAVRRQRRQLAFLVVTGEAGGMRQRSCFERTFVQPESVHTVNALTITVFVLRKRDLKIRHKIPCFFSREKTLTETRKRKSSRVVRRGFNVTVQTDARRRTLAREELLPVTTQTSLMFRKLSHIRKSIITLAHLFPILRWKRMTRTASAAMLLRQVRKARVVDSFARLERSCDERGTHH